MSRGFSMRTAALLLLLSAGAVTIAQTAPPAPGKHGPRFQMPPQFSVPHNSGKPHAFRFDPNRPFQVPNVIPQPRALPGHTLDPQIIVRPPQSAFRQQQPRPPLRQDLYPDLKLIPIEEARMEPIPITWPGFKAEPIPIAAPNAKAVPVATSQQTADAAPRN